MCKIRKKCCDNPLQGKLRVLKPNMAVVYFDQRTDLSQGGGLSKSSLRHFNCFHIFFLFYERANLTNMLYRHKLIFTVDGFQVQSITDENNDTAATPIWKCVLRGQQADQRTIYKHRVIFSVDGHITQ